MTSTGDNDQKPRPLPKQLARATNDPNGETFKSTSKETPSGFPSEGRLGGIDYGTVRIGIAICDPSQQWVTPCETYQRQGPDKDRAFFQQLAESEPITGWVIGLPLHCDGNESEKSREVREFARWLGQSTRIPIRLFDERFSTAEARRLLNQTTLSGGKRKQRLDSVAAQLILTHFLESRASDGSRSRQEGGLSQNEALDDQ